MEQVRQNSAGRWGEGFERLDAGQHGKLHGACGCCRMPGGLADRQTPRPQGESQQEQRRDHWA